MTKKERTLIATTRAFAQERSFEFTLIYNTALLAAFPCLIKHLLVYCLLVTVLAPLVVLLVEFLYVISASFLMYIYGIGRIACNSTTFLQYDPESSGPTFRFENLSLTFGRLTLGTITLWRALGASLGGFFGSLPGWYSGEEIKSAIDFVLGRKQDYMNVNPQDYLGTKAEVSKTSIHKERNIKNGRMIVPSTYGIWSAPEQSRPWNSQLAMAYFQQPHWLSFRMLRMLACGLYQGQLNPGSCARNGSILPK